MARLKIKVCGITNKTDALQAAALGADYIGLVFAPSSPRCLKISDAAQIVAALDGKTKTVGVFQNAVPEFIQTTRRQVGIDFVQLHGDESEQLAGTVIPAFKALSFNEEIDKEQIKSFSALCELLILDRPKSISDPRWLNRVIVANEWEEIKEPFLFAGGLNINNVDDAVLALSVSPGFTGLDVASGIESSVGLKDHSKMEEFFRRVNEVAKHAITR